MNQPTEAQKFTRERNFGKGIVMMMRSQADRLRHSNIVNTKENERLEEVSDLLYFIIMSWNKNTLEIKNNLGIKNKETR